MPHRKSNDRAELNADAAEETGPLRRCAVTRARLPKSELVRFALGPDGLVAADLSARLPGRGVWVQATRSAVEAAIKTGAFSRGFKTAAEASDRLADQVEALLVKRCQATIGLARKAGVAVSGFDQVSARLKRVRPGWLLEAADGAEDGRSKVYSLAKGLYGKANTAGALTAAELGMAFGRDRVIHGLLDKGAFSKRWSLDYLRLRGFRTAPEDDWFSGKDQ